MFVALLRGINVGGNNKVSMKDLKKLFEELGFTQVVTYINSGNIVFESSLSDREKLTYIIEKAIHTMCGFSVAVLVKSKKDIAAVCKKVPSIWLQDKIMKTDVMFLWDDIDNSKILTDMPHNTAIETLEYVSGALVWHLLYENYTKSKIPKMIGQPLYKKMTIRNINTVRKIYDLMQ